MSLNFKNLIHLQSFTYPSKYYLIDLINQTCSCPVAHEKRTVCKHMMAVGLSVPKAFFPKTHPTFSQAMSALVKSLRLRNPEEAVYWTIYMLSLPQDGKRFRLARRLLIGTSEDGHVIQTMETCSKHFQNLASDKTPAELLYYVAEIVRICKSPNWWHPDSGGPDYIYQSMVGQRIGYYLSKADKEQSNTRILDAIAKQDKTLALECVIDFGNVPEFGRTKQAELLKSIAHTEGHELAERLCDVHLSQKSALSGDNNFLCQAAWMLAGGVSPIAHHTDVTVTAGECYALIEYAKEAWKKPHLIPGWCCDGIHCMGTDVRFAGILPNMMAVIEAYKEYGRVDPDDKWLPKFFILDGLQIKS